MTINSLAFLLFFSVVFALYYSPLSPKGKVQNVLLLLASYFFYGYTDLRMLPLLLMVTGIFYLVGQGIEKYEDQKQSDYLLVSGIVLGIGMLVYFKYTNFFIQSFANLLNAVGLQTNWHSLKIVAPVGISFFVFRLVSYVIEVHRGMMSASKDILAFATYVAFFPCMLSGPIDRPDVFIPQLQQRRSFSYDVSVDGLRQILWGLFKKVVIADNLAQFVDAYLGGESLLSGSTTIIVAIAYTFQIYADFSGYSDMAIGVGKLLNLKVARNFNHPFFAVNIADFWHRWHMSLTSWVTDYVFTPLNFSFRRLRKWGMIFAILVNFLIVGLWHGASWNYVIYGLYHGLLFVPLILMGRMNANTEVKIGWLGLPIPKDFLRMILTFVLVVFGMLIFRCSTLGQFAGVITSLGQGLMSVPEIGAVDNWLFVIIMLVAEWVGRKTEHALDVSYVRSRVLRWSIYLLVCFAVFMKGGETTGFIYQVF